jgi:hypothetical protein
MDRFMAIVWGLVALGAILAFVICWIVYRNRQLRTARRIDELLEEYFQGRMPVGQLGQRARAIAGRGFFGGPMFLSLAASAFQHATDAKRAKQANSNGQEEVMRLFGDLKREFGVPDRYKLETRPGRE